MLFCCTKSRPTATLGSLPARCKAFRRPFVSRRPHSGQGGREGELTKSFMKKRSTTGTRCVRLKFSNWCTTRALHSMLKRTDSSTPSRITSTATVMKARVSASVGRGQATYPWASRC